MLKVLGVVVINYYAVHWAFYCLNQDNDFGVLAGIIVLVLLVTTDAVIGRRLAKLFIKHCIKLYYQSLETKTNDKQSN